VRCGVPLSGLAGGALLEPAGENPAFKFTPNHHLEVV
jgi:hypothetical protein